KPPLMINGATAIFTSENGGVVRAYGGEVSLTASDLAYVRPWASYSLVLGSQRETPTRTGAVPLGHYSYEVQLRDDMSKVLATTGPREMNVTVEKRATISVDFTVP
ncbi:MAG TPA: hypothetical protein VN914_15410, partial [Polyangia bacterium]|nr:hypothetical protein [Polyangia bacterium]